MTRIVRRPKSIVKDSKHAYKQGYLWYDENPWCFDNPHVFNSFNYREFTRGSTDAEFQAKVDGGYFDEH